MAKKRDSKKNQSHSSKTKIPRRLKKLRTFQILTVIFFGLFIASIFTGGFKDFFSSGIGPDVASSKAIDYINTQLLKGAANAELQEVNELDQLYKMKISIRGQEFSSYITKDGRYLFPQGIDLKEKEMGLNGKSTDSAPTTPTGKATADCSETPKKAKPELEVFVMSHCPYGTQVEKGLLPVLKLLKDKISFKLRFVYYAMHGDVEVNEELRQYCIQKEQEDKLLDYLECFLNDGNSESCLTSTKIDLAKLESCVASADKEFEVSKNLNDQSSWLSGRFPLVNIDKALNEKYGIRGSPSLVINGKKLNSGRDSASLLAAICCAFDEKPPECEEALSTVAPSPGFGFKTGGSASASAGCGA